MIHIQIVFQINQVEIKRSFKYLLILLLIDSWESNDSINSSLTIFSHSFELNETYQFMLQMINHENSSVQSIGYLIVKVENIQSPLIMIK